jgi:hypothetical protein
MKRILFLLTIVLTGNAFAQFTVPKIQAKSNTYDFGTIVEGEIVTTSFEIMNVGSGDLKIDQVRASCGCTAAQPAKNILKPGEKTSIKVDFNSKDRLGPQEKYVYVMSNDPKSPELKLSFKAVVVDKSVAQSADVQFPRIKLLKTEYDFGNVEEGKLVETKISFKNEGKGILEITDVKTSCGCTAALVSNKRINPGESGNVRIELDTANREGKLTRTVTIMTNDPDNPNPVITLYVNIEKRKL